MSRATTTSFSPPTPPMPSVQPMYSAPFIDASEGVRALTVSSRFAGAAVVISSNAVPARSMRDSRITNGELASARSAHAT